MAPSQPTNTKAQVVSEEEFKQPELFLSKELWFGLPIQLYQGFWCREYISKSVTAFQTHFQAIDTDIILASLPKAGTTWLKSLLFTIVNRKNYPNISQHPLYSKNPHELVPYFEFQIYRVTNEPDLTNVPQPRLLSTHLPYTALADSIKTSKCRIVYVCRNPLDSFVSSWYFFCNFDSMDKGNANNMEMMKEYASRYCKGKFPFGPYEDHVLGYWKESVQNPNKVLFLEYEGLKKEPKAHLKRLAAFLGCPFSEEEVNGNVIDDITKLCSLESLKEMEVNKNGKMAPRFENKALFRKGEIGGWTNELTPAMAKGFYVILEKLYEAGFSFTYYQTPPMIQFI